ncbi:hypothetical protein ASPFODRAFT_366214 [Aspergillus luchuensis CBS 106.47]|uniref:Uncharacterized protein n=1 Tax=Aspergillus luchuensis (strain CBS 106.47) TaxID=1137211 RepID=A0A1M3T513_ASPLC|nr:hypothetical protein ASPFODRAFT_366214 [Aspergillus luchuensis CBS 106.47]
MHTPDSPIGPSACEDGTRQPPFPSWSSGNNTVRAIFRPTHLTGGRSRKRGRIRPFDSTPSFCAPLNDCFPFPFPSPSVARGIRAAVIQHCLSWKVLHNPQRHGRADPFCGTNSVWLTQLKS